MKADTYSPRTLPISRWVQPHKELFALGSKKRTIKLPAVILTIVFVALRLGTSDNTSILLPVIGLVLIVLLMHTNATWGFALTLYDMCLLAEQVGVESWQILDLFRFRDMEFLVLMAIGIGMGALYFRGRSFGRLTKPIKIYLILISIVTIYSVIAYGLKDALQVSRILFFVALIFVMPAFCRDLDDLKRLLKYIFILVAISTLIDFAGFIIGDAAMMTPFNHNLDEAGRIWAGSGGVLRVWAGIGYAGYPVPFNFLAIFALTAIMVVGKLRPFSWVLVVGIAIALEALSISKSSAIGLSIGLGVIVLLGWRQLTSRQSFRAAALSMGLLALLLVSGSFIKDWNVFTEYTVRFTDLFEQLLGNQEGTATSRLDYFTTAPEVMSYSGGNVLIGIGYQMMPTEYGVRFRIAPFNISAFQESGQRISTTSLDSGWANVFWTLGLIGIGFFIWFIAYYLKTSLQLFRSTNDIVSKSLSLALFAYFVVYPLMNVGMNLIYGKQVQHIIQFVLLLGSLGLWLDYRKEGKPITNSRTTAIEAASL